MTRERADAELLGRLVWLHDELCRRVQEVEERHVAVSRSLDPSVGGTRDPDERMLELAVTLQGRAGRLRALRKDRREALRRLIRAYEEKLGYRRRPPGKRHPDGRVRIESVDQTGHHEIEPPFPDRQTG